VLIALPHLETAGSLVQALDRAGAYLLLGIFALSAGFSVYERRSHRLALQSLAARRPLDLSAPRLRMPVAREHRQGPIRALLLLAVLSFAALIVLVGSGLGGETARGPLFLLTVWALAYLLAVAAGYRANRRAFVAGVAWLGVSYFSAVEPVAYAATVPLERAVPGVTAWAGFAALSAWTFHLLAPGRLAAVDGAMSAAPHGKIGP
jgi:hypothetical protein